MPTIPTGLIPTGLIRKALILLTAGLAARVWKDSSESEPVVTPAERPAPPRRRTKTKAKRTATKAVAKPAPRRATPKATPRRRSKPKTAKPRAAKPAPTSTIAVTPTPTTAPTIRAGNGAAAALERITKLRDQGAISYTEFAAAKARILGAGMAPGESGEERTSFEAVGANVAADHANVAVDRANVAADHDLADMSRTPS
jgi:hypothetical protein